MKYEERLIKKVEEELSPIDTRDLEESFDNYLDEAYGTVEVCGYTFDCREILEELDNIAYREMFNNWLDSECYICYRDVNGEIYHANEVEEMESELDEEIAQEEEVKTNG